MINLSTREHAEAIADELTTLRHALHREPETGLHLPRTQAKVLTALDGLPLQITTGKRLSSVVAVLRGSHPGPAVLLRADMDALPLQEETGLPYASTVDDAMHACGHDQHTAILAGAAQLLSARQNQLAGSVVFMFQPGEEGHDGARLMIAEGLLEAAGTPMVGAYAVHVASSGGPLGLISARAGTQTAGDAELNVTVHGRGGHASAPHTAADPIPAAAEMVTALYTLVTRTTDPFDPVVLTVGLFNAGTRLTIIPRTARFEATVRATSAKAMAAFLPRAKALCQGIAAAHGLSSQVETVEGYPPMVAAAEAVQLGREVVTDLYGAEYFHTAEHPGMATDDFSRILETVPGVELGLSACPPDADPADTPMNHSSHAVFDDRALPIGTAVLAEMALRRLYQDPQSSPK